MAAYIRQSDQVAIMLSRAEADALRYYAEPAFEGEEISRPNPSTVSAANRAIQALAAATNRSARMAGSFEF